MDNTDDNFIYKFRAQKIIARWIVEGYDFIYIASNEVWSPCHDPEDSDENPNKYIPFWYEFEIKAVEKLAEFLHLNRYKDFKAGQWIK